MSVALCERCVWIFFKKQPTQRFCGDRCATAERVRRHRERRAMEKAAINIIDGGAPLIAETYVCDGCGNEFFNVSVAQTGGDPNRKPRRYHSVECREQHKKQRQVLDS